MANQPQVSVIIPVYNGAATLPVVLAGLEEQTLAADQFEVIVADDCSTDTTPALLTEYATRNPYSLQVLRQPENRGASAARNLAARQARGDYLVFIDADCLPEPHLLEHHLATLRQHSPSGGTVGQIIWSEEFKGGPLSEYYKKLYFPDQQNLDETKPVPFTYFVTSNAGLPRALFERLGGFDEDFRYLWDDTVLGYRLEQAGGQLWLDRQAVVYHHRPLLPGEALARFRRQGQEAMRLLAKYPELTRLVEPGEVLADRYQQEELYRMLARYALGLGYAEGAGRYFDTTELDALLERPELATNFTTWRDRRLDFYRGELNSLKEEQSRTLAYVRQLEAAYQREREQVATLQTTLAQEKAYSRGLERAQGYNVTGFNSQVAVQRARRWWQRGQQAARNVTTRRKGP